MKHIKRISNGGAKATVIEDVLCQVAQVVILILSAVNGSAPIADIADGKCFFSPLPGEGDNS